MIDFAILCNRARDIMMKTKSVFVAAEATGLPVEMLREYAKALNLHRRGVNCDPDAKEDTSLRRAIVAMRGKEKRRAFLTLLEISHKFHLNNETLKMWARCKVIPAVKIGGRYLINENRMRQWVNSHPENSAGRRIGVE